MKILLFKFPTKDRPAQFAKTLHSYINNHVSVHGWVSVFAININIEDEKSESAFSDACQGVFPYGNIMIPLDLMLILDKDGYKTKIEAINDFANLPSDWDIITLIADDMIPLVQGYNKIIIDQMEKHYPDGDGCLWFNDGHNPQTNTLPVMGNKYFKRRGYIYHPSYKSLWCDNEYTEIAESLKLITKIDRVIIEHRHPFFTGKPYDELYKKNDTFQSEDEHNYKERKRVGFPI